MGSITQALHSPARSKGEGAQSILARMMKEKNDEGFS
jgi:hypothetical protein